MASIPPTVKDYQQKLATLAAGHTAARRRLEAATARRASAAARHDSQVADAEGAVRQAVADMAAAMGAELTAHVLDMDVAEVRKAAKTETTQAGDRR